LAETGGRLFLERTMQAFFTHPLTLRFLSFGMVLGLWEYGGRIPISAGFPTLFETLAAMFEMIGDGSLLRALAITCQPLFVGLLISGLVGVALGVAMGLNRMVEWFGAPMFIVLQAAPMAALVPLLVFAYGAGMTSKVLTVCIMALPVIALNACNAVRHTPTSLVEMGQSFLGSRWQLVRRIILPAASPVIFAGLRLGGAAGFIGAILAELLITPTGIGDLITYNQSIAEYPKMYAAILSVIVLSVLLIEAFERVETTLVRPDKRVA
jgi:ABC-type nitrate/sulfonate/bicarbonate transport system permease component